MNYAFLNADDIVVNVIAGSLTSKQLDQFLVDYAALFGATRVIAVDVETSVWIDGSYTDGVFAPPPEPIIEPIVEPIPDQPTEGTPDGIPIIE